MGKVTCLGCGNIFKRDHSVPFVNSCPACIRRFDTNEVEDYLKKFYKGDK
jgi:hypothetical protein